MAERLVRGRPARDDAYPQPATGREKVAQIDPGTPTWLRAHNDRTALRLLLERGPLTRAQLGELSGMSKPTATQMISRLESAGLVSAVGTVSGGRGPNAVSYGVRADRLLGVAVSMQATVIQAVVVDALDAEHPVVELPTAASGRTPEQDIRTAVAVACEAAQVGTRAVRLVAVGVQAAVDSAADTLSLTDTLPGWPAAGARTRIEQALGLDVTVENDVNLAAMAERAVGAGQQADSFVLFWLGEGLGLGVDLGGVVHRGSFGSAGEIGYLPLPAAAAALDPDATDATELLGGPAIVRLAGLTVPGTAAELAARFGADPALLTAVADRVAVVLASALAVLDPALVVLGGPTSAAGGPALAELVADRVAGGPRPGLVVQPSRTGPRPVLLGARQLLVDQIRERLVSDITAGG
ncbi:MAG: ROK family transcriptional regulator [Propionicimonas sp.]|uniref:ROK family transcriptional regulator n=1 Tax=Propionicimonas sp. TaxID=1955623 RepID=UPI002B1F8738|nr:ROK family transcriptional regulator [Propionicimonas sp.]MEA4943424.1 ROK family transcriptional regulator [Propionicimonas sp.]